VEADQLWCQTRVEVTSDRVLHSGAQLFDRIGLGKNGLGQRTSSSTWKPAAAKEVLPQGARVFLFGSRTDDARRGGDIDLLVEPPTPVDASLAVDMSTRLAARLYRSIGERRIEIVVAAASEADDRLIVLEARRQAIELVRT